MGMLHYLPLLHSNMWVMGEPKDKNFMKPTKLEFTGLIFEKDMPSVQGWGSYQESMVFSNDLVIPVYDSGMKTGHRMLLNYYVTDSSAALFAILHRMITLDKIKEMYDIEMINSYIKSVERDNPELLL